MEFGGQYCTPNQPDCMNCVHFNSCVAGKTQTFSNYPVKSKKTKVRDRYFHYLYIEHNDEICFNKRGPNDVWENLYEFPLIETESKDKPTDQLLDTFELCFSTKHILSHQRIHAQFYKTNFNADFISNYPTKKRNELEEIAISRLIDKFFEQN
jgi:A/G-specific adenine glycosylase